METSDYIRRILQHRDDVGKWTQARVAERLGVKQPTVHHWLKGSEPDGAKREQIKELYDQLFGKAAPRGGRTVPVKRYIGAGQAVYALDDGGTERVEAREEAHPDTIAAIVRGDSMLPRYEDGTILYWSKTLPPEEMINRNCVVQLATGEIMVKELRHGSEPGLYTLWSLNSAPIEDVAVEWVARIDWIKPAP